MSVFAQTILMLYGVLLIIGGIVGYAEKRSVISLLAGGISGVLALAAFTIARNNPKAGFGLGLAVAILMIGSQAPRYMKDHKPVPLMIIVASVVTLIALVAALTRKNG